MSDDTQNSRDSGDSRRRRSRGGQNRSNNNNNSNRSDGRSDGRQEGGGRRQGGGNRSGGRTKQGSGSGSGKPQRRPMPASVQLSWWQKLLKTVGLYKEPVRPPRPERRPDREDGKGGGKGRGDREPRRTKTRDARSDDSSHDQSRGDSRGEEREERPKRGGKRRNNDRNDHRPRGGDPSTVENRRVYVGNLSYDVTESDLEELFKGVGAVRRVEIVYNRSTHRSKGYGFIEMIDIDEAKRTVEVLHDQFFMGRKLTVSGAKSKDHEEAENEDEKNIAENQIVPPLAPTKPEVTSLIDDEVTEEKAPEPELKPEIVTSDENLEVPTEEFSPEADTPEEIKDQAKS